MAITFGVKYHYIFIRSKLYKGWFVTNKWSTFCSCTYFNDLLDSFRKNVDLFCNRHKVIPRGHQIDWNSDMGKKRPFDYAWGKVAPLYFRTFAWLVKRIWSLTYMSACQRKAEDHFVTLFSFPFHRVVPECLT